MTWFARMAFLLGFFWDNNFQNHHIQIAPYLQDLGGGRVACGKNLGAQKSQACIVSTTFCRQPVLNIKKGVSFMPMLATQFSTSIMVNSVFNINFQHQFSMLASQFSGSTVCYLIWNHLGCKSHEANSWQTMATDKPMARDLNLALVIWVRLECTWISRTGWQWTGNVWQCHWISKWLVNDEDMGHKKRKRCLYMVPDFFWNMKDWWIQLMFFFFFGTNLTESRRGPCGWTDFLGHQIEVGSLKTKHHRTQIGRCPASRRVFVRNFSKGKLRAHEWIPPQCLRKRFQDRYMYMKFY